MLLLRNANEGQTLAQWHGTSAVFFFTVTHIKWLCCFIKDLKSINLQTNNSYNSYCTHKCHFKVVFGQGVVQFNPLPDFLSTELRPQLLFLLHILNRENMGNMTR